MIVKTFIGYIIFCLIRKFKFIAQIRNTKEQFVQFNINNLVNILSFQWIEDHYVINSVQEFGSKSFLQSIFNHAFCMRFFLFFLCRSAETNALSKIFNLTGANIGSHDNYGISEINFSTKTIG